MEITPATSALLGTTRSCGGKKSGCWLSNGKTLAFKTSSIVSNGTTDCTASPPSYNAPTIEASNASEATADDRSAVSFACPAVPVILDFSSSNSIGPLPRSGPEKKALGLCTIMISPRPMSRVARMPRPFEPMSTTSRASLSHQSKTKPPLARLTGSKTPRRSKTSRTAARRRATSRRLARLASSPGSVAPRAPRRSSASSSSPSDTRAMPRWRAACVDGRRARLAAAAAIASCDAPLR
mmetsp:Transcript_80175/g.225056  ORF Transcript_80175/g.225056 Transcript_80175/m.225056 type:complete len:239 (-) Transcript_80175:104-820(-)